MNLKLAFDIAPGEYRGPEFVDGEVHLQRIPGAPIIARLACGAVEAKPLDVIIDLMLEREEAPCSVWVDYTPSGRSLRTG